MAAVNTLHPHPPDGGEGAHVQQRTLGALAARAFRDAIGAVVRVVARVPHGHELRRRDVHEGEGGHISGGRRSLLARPL
eukprot:131408-Prorocentrum_minimum.AAC.1